MQSTPKRCLISRRSAFGIGYFLYICRVNKNLNQSDIMTIAVDFDGTIVEHRYPAIGRELPFAIDTLKRLTQEHHKLILWSVREGKLLDEAVEYCRKRGLEFFAVNSDYPGETPEERDYSRKLKVDLFIDDRNLGGLPDWGVIYQMIHDRMTFDDWYRERFLGAGASERYGKKRKGFFSRLFG